MRALVKLLTIIWGRGLLLQLLLSVALVYALTIDRAMLAGSILNYVAFLAHWSSRRHCCSNGGGEVLDETGRKAFRDRPCIFHLDC